MGSNSTRLLIADVADGRVHEVERQTRVTQLGRGVEHSSTLSSDAIEDVCMAVGDYKARLEELGASETIVIATSAVRDASNGDAFVAELRERFALNARILTGEEEARLTYLGVMEEGSANSTRTDSTLVIDIGGGSTELVVGSGAEIGFHTSLQLGVVRHTERHLTDDPPSTGELEALAADIRREIDSAIATEPDAAAEKAIAVAGTPTSLAAIDLELTSYDSDRVHGHRLSLKTIQRMLSRLASTPLTKRLHVPGLHPGRAPTIVAGTVILIEVMRAFGLDEIEVSDRDILHGSALTALSAAA